MHENAIVPQTTIAVTTSSRPKRVAFLVHPEETNDGELNEIIRYCVGVWGGRFNAIIPTTGVEIAPDWWNLLVVVDPDIIYSFLPLDNMLIQRINRYILPAKILEVTPEKRTRIKGTPRINSSDIGALSIEDIPLYIYTRERDPFGKPSFFYIKDVGEDTQNLRFLLRNFGTLPESGSMLLAFSDIPHEVVEPDVVTPADILEKLMSHSRNAVVPIDLCHMYATRKYLLNHEDFTSGFHLVIGDSPLDIIYAWNRALTSEIGFGRRTFWLPQKLCKEIDLLRLVGEWIQKTFFDSNHSGVDKIISYSVNRDELVYVADRMRDFAHFSFAAVKLAHDQYPPPNVSQLVQGSFLGGFPSTQQPELHTDQVPLSENKGLVGFPRPPFLVESHPQSGWMVDLKIQYHPERYNYTNIRPSWQLPKRLGVADIFFHVDPSLKARVVTGGLPSIEVLTVDKAIRIRIPSDLDVVWSCLYQRHTNTDRKHPDQEPRFRNLRVSVEGRYLQGMLRLFGNVFYAGNAFEDPFWRNVFLKMAGRPDFKKDLKRRKGLVLKVFNKIFEEDSTPISVDDSPRLKHVAEILARSLTLRDAKPEILTLKNLKNYFGELRGTTLKKKPDDDWWIAYKKFDEWKELELKEHLESGVLLQGAELSCPHCGTRQFYVVDDLNSKLCCNGCLFQFSLEPAPEWSFRLNSLVLNALRKCGTLSVLHALYEQVQLLRGMFLYLPCQDIFEKDNKDSFTDLDLVYISEGKFHIGEVKPDPNGFKPDVFDKLRVVAEELLPDVVILAAPGEMWPQEVKTEIRRFEEALASVDVKVKPLLLRW